MRAARETRRALQAGARREDIDAARARVSVVDAQLAQLDKTRADATVAAPVSGIVTQKLTDAGEMVAPRMPLLVITDLDHAWANLFVPEPLMPRVALGQAATVLTDAGDQVAGKVTFISPQAEFTPRNVQTADERSKLVYRIKVSVDNSAGVLKQGMPVTRSWACRAEAAERRRRAMSARSSSPASSRSTATTQALDAVTLDVQRGEMFGLIGSDGAGKTTAIRLMCGLLHADAGSIRVLGHDPVRAASRADRTGRLPVAALQSVWRSHHRREHRVLCRDPRRVALPARAATSCST